MITLSSTNQIHAAKEAVEQCKAGHPEVFTILFHMINLTRALQFKYQYMGSLITGKDASGCAPAFTERSVLQLYLREMSELLDHPDSDAIRSLFKEYEEIGFARLSLLALGKQPEQLSGSLIIK